MNKTLKKTLSIILTLLMIVTTIPFAFAAGDGVPLTIDLSEVTSSYIQIGSGYKYYDEDGYIITGTNTNVTIYIYDSCDITFNNMSAKDVYLWSDTEENVTVTLDGDNYMYAGFNVYRSRLTINGDDDDTLNIESNSCAFSTSGNSGTLTVNGGKINAVTEATDNYPTINCDVGFTLNGGEVTASNNYFYVISKKININGGILNVISTSPDCEAINGDVEIAKGALLTVTATYNVFNTYYDITSVNEAEENLLFFAKYNKYSNFVPVQDIKAALEGKTYAEIKLDTHTHLLNNGSCACGYKCPHENYNGDGYCNDCYSCLHLGYDVQTYKCITCGVCYHNFVPNAPRFTVYKSNGSYDHTVTERCEKCLFAIHTKTEPHAVTTPATCLKKAVCEQCGEFGSVSTNNHENPTPIYSESTTDSTLHEIRYECCGDVTTEAHTDEDVNNVCDDCGSTNFHEHSFVYTYEKYPSIEAMHYIIKSCTGCDTVFERTNETCIFNTNCQGSVCPKCRNTINRILPNKHASTKINYTDNGDGTHTGYYTCCNAVYKTEQHDENCDICTQLHKHSFVYTYREPDTTQMIMAKLHYVYKFCTGCDESFAQTVEACSIVTDCKGSTCTKCENIYEIPTDPNNHASTEISYTDNGDGTHTGKYACCGAEYETVAHDENCNICTQIHEHSFVYTYKQPNTAQMILGRLHYVYKSCTGCNESFAQTTEVCSIVTDCKGSTCTKCENIYEIPTDPNNHASTEISYTDNGDGTHTGKYACCGAEYETVEHDENCELCIVHEHSFVYTYKIGNLQMVMRYKHYVNKSCTDCNESFEQTTEACLLVTNCKGGTCTKCENIYEILTDPNKHASTEINYTDNGDGTHSGVHACCDAEYVTNEPHSGGTATCVSGKVCEHCKAEYGEVLGHDIITDEAVAPTCIETGLTEGSHCSRCDDMTVSQEVVPALNHKDTLVQVEAQAKTCTEIGWDAYEYCTACDYSTYEEIPASHEIKTVDKKDATCTQAGHEAYEYCTECDYTTYKEIPSNGHTPLEAVKENEVAPKCGVAGSYDLVIYCDVCGEELDRDTTTVDALTHTDADGDYKCDNGCGHEFEKPVDPTPDVPDTPDEPADDTCDHICHKSGFIGFIWKIVQFFWKLFKMNPVCECGVAHY